MAKVRIKGDTSGHIDLTVPDVAGTHSCSLSDVISVTDMVSGDDMDVTGNVTATDITASGAVTATNITRTPYDAIPAYGSSNYNIISWDTTEHALKMVNTEDSTIGVAYPAFRVDTSSEYKLTMHYKGSAAETGGLWIAIMEYDDELPSGKTHISHNASSSPPVVQEDTRFIQWKTDSAIPTDWTTSTYTYTPTSTAKFASVVVLRWNTADASTALFLKDLLVQPSGAGGPTVVKSSEFSYADMGTYGYRVTHGQSTAPDQVFLQFLIKTAEDGWAVGDVINIYSTQEFDETDYVMNCYGNSTYMGIQYNAKWLVQWTAYGYGTGTQGSANDYQVNNSAHRYRFVGIWY